MLSMKTIASKESHLLTPKGGTSPSLHVSLRLLALQTLDTRNPFQDSGSSVFRQMVSKLKASLLRAVSPQETSPCFPAIFYMDVRDGDNLGTSSAQMTPFKKTSTGKCQPELQFSDQSGDFKFVFSSGLFSPILRKQERVHSHFIPCQILLGTT